MAQKWGGSLGQRRINRRRILAAAGAGVAVSAVACNTSKGGAPAASKPGAQTAKQPKKGGVVNYAGGLLGSFDLAGRSWDPHIQTQSGVRSLRLFYDTLLAYDLVTYEVQP